MFSKEKSAFFSQKEEEKNAICKCPSNPEFLNVNILSQLRQGKGQKKKNHQENHLILCGANQSINRKRQNKHQHYSLMGDREPTYNGGSLIGWKWNEETA